MIPVAEELDLKKAAAAAGEKAVEMVRSKELLGLTGYVHGGCSPIGMKKTFPTFIDETAAGFATVIFSAGKIGFQIETSIAELQKNRSLENGGADGLRLAPAVVPFWERGRNNLLDGLTKK